MTKGLFVIVLVTSFIVVRIGAVAFQWTGLEWSPAKFQALSCFTGTGFTTKEAELIAGKAQRRRIASILMVLGNAGLVLMTATVADWLLVEERLRTSLSRRFLPFQIRSPFASWITPALLGVLGYMVYRLLTWPKVSRPITRCLGRRIIRLAVFTRVTAEERLPATGGYGVSHVAVLAGSPVIDKSLAESGLRSYDTTVLAIVRQGQTVPNPPAEMTTLRDDEFICFGKLGNIRSRILMNP